MRLALVAFTAALLASPASAQQSDAPVSEGVAAAVSTPAPTTAEPRVNQLIVYGDDPCPESTNEEIIVCARLPDSDRYRIPPSVRDNPEDPSRESWTNRAVELSYVGRSGTDSCSPSGPGGFTGCFNQMVREARAERSGAGDVNWNRMINEAREERMRRIGEAEAEEAEQENTPD